MSSLRMWLYVFWNRFYTRKSHYPCNYWNPQFLLLLLLPSRSSFARGWPLRMTIWRRPVPPDHYLQEAGRSGWSFARGWSLHIIICKRPAPPDDHLQEAGPFGSSFARGWPLILTTTKGAWKMHFWDPPQWDKMCFEYQRIKFQWVNIFTFGYIRGRGGWPRPPLTSAWLWNIRFFYNFPRICAQVVTLNASVGHKITGILKPGSKGGRPRCDAKPDQRH